MSYVFRYPWFALAYILFAFLLLPLLVFGLSLCGTAGLAAVGVPLIVLLGLVGVITILQRKAAHILPVRLRSWEESGIPAPLRSLEPYDKLLHKLCGKLCKKKYKTTDKMELALEKPLAKETDVAVENHFSIDDAVQ